MVALMADAPLEPERAYRGGADRVLLHTPPVCMRLPFEAKVSGLLEARRRGPRAT